MAFLNSQYRPSKVHAAGHHRKQHAVLLQSRPSNRRTLIAKNYAVATPPSIAPSLGSIGPPPQLASLHPAPSDLQPISGEPRARFDVLGLAQAMVDYTAGVPDETILSQPPFNVAKGGRRVISLQERHEVMATLDSLDCESQVSPGGSLANTLVGISRLAKAHGQQLQVAMAGCVGADTLGSYFNAQLNQAGVQVVVDHDNPAHTGTVMVLTTPDAHRSFLSFFDSGSLQITPTTIQAITSSRIVVIEGYMLEMPGADTWLPKVAQLARIAGCQVVLTAGDPTVVRRHKAKLTDLLDNGLVDIIFCNREEASELLSEAATEQQGKVSQTTTTCGSTLAASLSSLATMAVITDGSRGAFIGFHGQVNHFPPHWAPNGPVDVCGAGDAYAAGILYTIMCGYDLQTAGQFAARVASSVISRHGAQLELEDAKTLVQSLPDHVLLPLL